MSDLLCERDNLEHEYKKAMQCINEYAADLHKIRKRMSAIKDAACYRNLGGISTLSLLADIEKMAQNALDEPPTNLDA